jgi:two-component system phosphate regulon sensor histidine kinase PhoR
MAAANRHPSPWFVAAGLGLLALAGLVAFGRPDERVVPALLLITCIAAFTALGAVGFRRRSHVDATIRAVDQLSATPPYAALVETLPSPILVITALDPEDITNRRFIFANRAARDLLRLDQVSGVLVQAVRDPQVLEAADEALFGGIAAECLYEIAGAQPRTLRVQARPLELAANGARQALIVFHDETELRQSERTRADFLANASHELRTPLASLLGFIETLRGHARQDEGARERFLAIMQAQAERMSRLIDDLMSLSRIELNEHVAPADVVDLALAARDAVDAAAPLAQARGVRLEPDLPAPGAAMVVGDRDQLVQVAQNLIDNAVKYSRPGDVVAIGLKTGLTALQAGAGERPEVPRLSLLTPDRPQGDYAALVVSDRGAGMAREHLPRLTERFYRVEGQKSGERSGTGLGLAIVKHIANRHRGGLLVESAEGAGTTFTVYFPAKA